MEAPGIGRNTADIFALIQALFYRLGQEQVTREYVLSNWEAVLNFMVKRLGHEKIKNLW